MNISKVTAYYSIAFLQGICLTLVPAASFIFQESQLYGLSDKEYGALYVPMVAASVVAALVFGQAAKWVGITKVFFAGFAVLGLYLFFLFKAAWTTGDVPLLFVRLMWCELFLGLGLGLLLTTLNGLCIRLYPKHTATVLTGLHGSFGIGAAIGPLLVGFFNEAGDWTHSVWITLILGAVLLGWSVLIRAHVPASTSGNESKRPAPAERGSFPKVFYIFMAMLVCYGIVESFSSNWATIYLTQDKGYSGETASICLSLFWGFLTIGRFLAVPLTQRCEAGKLLRFSPFLITAGLLLLLLNRSETQVFWIYAMLGLGCSYVFPVVVGCASHRFPEWSEMIASLFMASLMAGVGLGSVVTGWLRDLGVMTLGQGFLMAIVTSVVLIFLAFLIKNSQKATISAHD